MKLAAIPDGRYEDYLDDDGPGEGQIKISVRVEVAGEGMTVDFTGSSPQVEGPVTQS